MDLDAIESYELAPLAFGDLEGVAMHTLCDGCRRRGNDMIRVSSVNPGFVVMISYVLAERWESVH